MFNSIHVGITALESWYIAGQSTQAPLTTRATVANTLYAAPLVSPRGGVIDKLSIRVTTAGGAGVDARLGIYRAASDTDLYPGNLILDAGTVLVSTIGVKSLDVSKEIQGGILHWLALLVETGTQPILSAVNIIDCENVLGINNLMTIQQAGLSRALTFGALPSTFGAAALPGSTHLHAIAARFSA